LVFRKASRIHALCFSLPQCVGRAAAAENKEISEWTYSMVALTLPHRQQPKM
jgi:hypothetical protein